MNQHLERLDGLAPVIRQPVRLLLERCQAKLQRTLLIVYGWRSVQAQALLYQQGRVLDRESGDWVVADPSAIVTKAKPGTTAHNVITKDGQAASVAVDLIPLHPDGTPEWDVGHEFWDDLYELAWKVGLDPLGDPIGSYLAGDQGHFEEPGWTEKLDGLGLVLPVNTFTTPV